LPHVQQGLEEVKRVVVSRSDGPAGVGNVVGQRDRDGTVGVADLQEHAPHQPSADANTSAVDERVA
jgi:hypothetical protein